MAATREADLPIAARPTQHSALRTPHFIWLNLFWFANNLHWGALLSIVVPSQVDKLFGNKELNYPLVVVGGTLAAVIVHPLAGALSDRTTARLGRRRPWLLWGTLPNLIGLGLMAIAPSVPLLALGYLVVQVANNAVNAPWSAVIADQVPAAQRGAASGWNGLLTVAGTVVGSLVGGLIVNKERPLDEYRVQLLLMYGLIAAIQAVAVLLTAWRVRETPIATARPFNRADIARTYWVSLSAGRDFFWVCLTRFMMQQGMCRLHDPLRLHARLVHPRYRADRAGAAGARTGEWSVERGEKRVERTGEDRRGAETQRTTQRRGTKERRIEPQRAQRAQR